VIAGHVDRVCVMYAGKLVEHGTVASVQDPTPVLVPRGSTAPAPPTSR
jgi:ABC-type glutathione transport system ATPase component